MVRNKQLYCRIKSISDLRYIGFVLKLKKWSLTSDCSAAIFYCYHHFSKNRRRHSRLIGDCLCYDPVSKTIRITKRLDSHYAKKVNIKEFAENIKTKED